MATTGVAWWDLTNEVDALITDPPYSEITHTGHDASERAGRSALPYAAWRVEDVRAFVAHWAPRVSGWVAVFTDTALVPAWTQALASAGRTTFAPIPCVELGGRVRLRGDGPACWSVFLIVARPRSLRWLEAWRARRRARGRGCSLPGAYVGTRGQRDPHRIPGGKPYWMMRAIVDDYSEPGDVVCDPCAGAGTTLVAAIDLGRRVVWGEIDPERHAAVERRVALRAAEQFTDHRGDRGHSSAEPGTPSRSLRAHARGGELAQLGLQSLLVDLGDRAAPADLPHEDTQLLEPRGYATDVTTDRDDLGEDAPEQLIVHGTSPE